MTQWQPPQYDPRRHQQQMPPGQYPPPGYGQPPAPYGQPYPQQAYPPPQYFARESETVTGMSGLEMAVHWTLIICSCGLWYPFYAARRHGANRRSRTRYR